MTDAELKATVDTVFVELFEIPAEKLKPGAHIFEDLGLDSLDIVDLIAAMQKKLGVQIRNDQRAQAIRTMQDLYDYLKLIHPPSHP